MPRPPGRIHPILSNSPNEWVNHLARRHAAFAALAVTPEERGQLDRWLVSRFVMATLELEGIDVARKPWTRHAGPAQDAAPFIITQLTNAAREVIRLTNAEGQLARLTPELLVKLGGAGFRTDDACAEGSSARLPAAYVAQAVENACDWFAAESFAELNPIEQAAIVLLRLATIRPFEQANQATALVAASLFTLRAGLPPLVMKPERHTAFRQAMIESEQMNMQPLVELMADAVSSTLGEMVSFVRQARGERE
ncbi:MAG TPA: Fic family protein [Blastocatellia bacterium]|nr:Fic family protein [Blastocatellia bacterium]